MWTEQMRAQLADVPILPLDKLRELPEAGPLDGGVYFLWSGDELIYIGKSKQIQHRLELQSQANRYNAVRQCDTVQTIPYERHTCLVLDSSDIAPPWLEGKMKTVERAYIAHYEPPYNCLDYNPGT